MKGQEEEGRTAVAATIPTSGKIVSGEHLMQEGMRMECMHKVEATIGEERLR